MGTAQGRIAAGSFAASPITAAVTGGANLNIEFGTGTLTLAQLEAGTNQTMFENRPEGAEMDLCLRYTEVQTTTVSARIYGMCQAVTATVAEGSWCLAKSGAPFYIAQWRNGRFSVRW
ncbi:hypothetical protein ACFWP0_19855 [Achromobacter sp. NPDC058515]|uniref:hypothetical protein n=1 Tax=Achromobacter sp. NPDC058515 TaxID=3346533 RepID=UPI00365803DC